MLLCLLIGNGTDIVDHDIGITLCTIDATAHDEYGQAGEVFLLQAEGQA